MGQKKSRLKRVQAAQPFCTYCAGGTTESVDHCPPIAVFDERARLAGLEFGACNECHEGTRKIDNIVAALSRITISDPANPDAENELYKYLEALNNNHPEIVATLGGTAEPAIIDGRLVYTVPFERKAAPSMDRALSAFAARFGLAVYRDATGKVATDCDVVGYWFTNFDLHRNVPDARLISALGRPATLIQGKKTLENQFLYWSAVVVDDDRFFASFAVFRMTLAFMAIIGPTGFGSDAGGMRFSPGFLKNFNLQQPHSTRQSAG